MRYFATLPKVLNTNPKGVSTLLTNIKTRVNVINSVFNEPLLFYKYDVKDSDTPEIVAHKYYGDSYYYWVVLLFNQMQHPIWSWPLASNVFEDFVRNKYGESGLNDINYYEEIQTKTNLYSGDVTIDRIKLNEDDYNSLVESNITYTLPSGDLNIVTTKRQVTNYEYEYELNESKRQINLLNSQYLPAVELEFKNLYK
jgi:hypothetical protein